MALTALILSAFLWYRHMKSANAHRMVRYEDLDIKEDPSILEASGKPQTGLAVYR